jgi:hypothetical protein
MSPRKKIHDKPGRPLKPIVEPRPSIRLAIEQSERLQIALKLRHMHLPHLSSLTGIRKETLKRIKFPLSRPKQRAPNRVLNI